MSSTDSVRDKQSDRPLAAELSALWDRRNLDSYYVYFSKGLAESSHRQRGTGGIFFHRLLIVFGCVRAINVASSKSTL